MRTKKFLLLLSLAVLGGKAAARPAHANGGYPITQVPFTAVKLMPNTFWGQRLQASRDITIPLAFAKCEETGRYKNFEWAADYLKTGRTHKVTTGFSFDDTDVYKTIEGACYMLQTFPDKRLVHYMDSVLDIVGAAQEKDGYLYTVRTMNPSHPHEWAGDRRWVKEEDLSHELYNLGHMADAAVAHWQATGSRKFLDICCRYADCVVREVGPLSGQSRVVPGHQIAEMALAKLYIATGKKEYLDEAKFFLDYRGKTDHKNEYSQSHEPVVEQSEAVGHAVRAGYMYAGMADVAALTGDSDYIHAIDRIWDNIVSKKYYITGGVGATANGEAFGKNYELPNMSAYCETCAAIAQVYLNYRLFLLHGESKYYDCLERTLYNGVLSGVSIDGGKFFYPNPLESMGQHQRQPWFGCACCPSNIARFIPSLPGYIYAVKDRNVYVNLFTSNTVTLKVGGKDVVLQMTTNYPWDGDVKIKVLKNEAGKFNLRIRIPGWVRNEVAPSSLYSYSDNVNLGYHVTLNNLSKYPEGDQLENGYYTLDCNSLNRKFKKGDVVAIHFDMEPRVVRANNQVEADRGRVAVERGPLVYCAEWPDNDCNVLSLLLNQEPKFKVQPMTMKVNYEDPADRKQKSQDYEMQSIQTDAQVLAFDKNGRLEAKDVKVKLIPYFSWNHRGSGNMDVWMAQDLMAVKAAAAPSLANRSKVTASIKSSAIGAVNDRLVPKDGNDRSAPYIHWWPKKNTTEWLVYEFPETSEVSQSVVYFFDDQPWGGCTVPKSWNIQYRDEAGQWRPVQNASGYPTVKGDVNRVRFDRVKTSALKLEIQQPENLSTGVFEWEVK